MVSKVAFDRTIPVNPPIVNRKINPRAHNKGGSNSFFDPKIVASHLNTLIPVGIAIIIVAAVKYARVSISMPTVYMWWAQTIKPKIPIPIIANTIPNVPNGFIFPDLCITIWEIAPKPGRMRIYTSGWPKNQNKCWYKTGSPPPEGSKKDVFIFRSVNNIVIAPAKTGSDKRSKITVTFTDQINRVIWCSRTPCVRPFIIVVIKLIDAKMDEIPARWSEKIARSTEGPACAMLLDRGG